MTLARVLSNLVFFVFVLIINNFPTGYTLKHKNERCEQISPCKCIFPDGKKIDLTQNVNTIESWISLDDKNERSILFQPCKNLPVGSKNASNDCFKGVSVCLHDHTSNAYINLGKMEDGKFVFDHARIKIYLKYETKNRMTNIELSCGPNKVEGYASSTNTYELHFQTPGACFEPISDTQLKTADSVSAGSVFLILFLILILCYFGGGMIALRIFKGAEGREMIPNYDFWADLPYLVRDGVLFTARGFQLPTVYDRI